jgi:O-antigen/teichoic acid export membrane protein
LISLLYGEKYTPAVTVIRLSLIGVAFEILTTLLIRSFITNENPKHHLQWLVYLSIICVMTTYLLIAKYEGLIELLNIIGSSIAVSNFAGFLVALFLLNAERNHGLKKMVI